MNGLALILETATNGALVLPLLSAAAVASLAFGFSGFIAGEDRAAVTPSSRRRQPVAVRQFSAPRARRM